MDKKIIILIAAVSIMLAGCGNKNDTSATGNDSRVAGGAVTKVTTQEEDEAVETTKAPDETEAPADDGEEQGPTGADSYEHSLTAAFAEKLEARNFSVTYALNDIDSGEGMQLQYEETLEVNGTGAHQNIINSDGTIEETYILDGECYSADSESGEFKMTARGNVMGDICSVVFGFSPAESEFTGAETFSDGTVQETFVDETNTTFVCTYADGVLTACEGAGYLRDYKGFTEGGVSEIKLPESN
jgi:hypothetical protein